MTLIQDVDSFFNTRIISVETDENKHCKAVPIDNYKVKNTLFDGQALIDTSIFPEWGEGYILLRHHLCKMAAFHSNIQLFMKEYFGDRYETATVKDMWGNDVRVKDIKLITTDNAMKWLKFDVSYDYWSEWVRANDCMFGIVKTAISILFVLINSFKSSILRIGSPRTVNPSKLGFTSKSPFNINPLFSKEIELASACPNLPAPIIT